MSSSMDPSSEMVMVDAQDVACEVVIDGFDVDVQYEDNQVVEVEEGDVPAEYVNDPSVANEYYQYEEVEGDPGTVYLFDEDTDQIHQLNPEDFETKSHHHHHHHEDLLNTVEEQEIDVEYVEQTIPSTSSSQSTSSAGSMSSGGLPGTSSQQPPNTYYIRKTVAPGKPIYSPVTFQTTYSEGPSARRPGKRLIKRTHVPLGADELETMMEDSQTLKKLQAEISTLRKDNEQMKKEYETVHRRLETVTMVLSEAKAKNKEANEEKKQLLRELAVARSTNSQLVKQVCPEPRFGF